ncbi:MAG TPA: ribosome maturation factor RimM [Fimbriimonadaceae bacterium]|nr:ribosome maturation factor RimM [Fimbriimonadaceae bacterium]
MAGRRPASEPDGHVRVGQIVGPFGIKGAVKVKPLTDFLERFEVGATVFVDGEPHKVLSFHWHKDQVRLGLEGVDTPEQAEDLRWAYLTLPSSDRPEMDEDEFLASDLIGLDVVEGGKLLGTVEDVLSSPAHDILKVGDAMIPLVSQFVKKIDLQAGTIDVELIEGLRPGDEA